MKILFLALFITLVSTAFSQKEMSISSGSTDKRKFLSKTFISSGQYENGTIRFEGAYLKCTVRSLGVDIYEKRKSGKWIFYYSNGKRQRIENYNRPKDCSEENYKSGKWQYWSEDGALYLEEEYLNDTLITTCIDVFKGNTLAQKFITKNAKNDTLIFLHDTVSQNLVMKADFEMFNFKPIILVNNGYNQIEDIIPYWTSPDQATPDYYNSYRSIRGVFNLLPTSNSNGFVGLILYLKRSEKYNENLQSRLRQRLDSGKMYCFKVKMLLSQNSGYSIDKFGVRFSQKQFTIEQLLSNSYVQNMSFVNFDKTLNETQSWEPLCGFFVAKGGEEFITLGRFAELNNVKITHRISKHKNALDINESAYYLIDNIELFPVASQEECNCYMDSIQVTQYKFDSIPERGAFKDGDKIILSNVLFDLNSSQLLPSSEQELVKLRDFLASHFNIRIKLIGHTDNLGSDQHNLNLSISRAKAVMDWLVQNGIGKERLQYEGRGFSDPFVDNISENNRQLNRRVEFQIIIK